MKNNLGFAKISLIVLIIIIAGVITGEIIYLLQNHDNDSKIIVNTLDPKESESENLGLEIVLNCGTIFSNINKSESIRIMNCMDENYKNCKPAKVNFDIDTKNAKIITYFEIIGLKENLCQVKIKYPEYTLNPEWEGLEMICSFDKNKEFKQIAYNQLDLNKCEGELAEIMK